MLEKNYFKLYQYYIPGGIVDYFFLREMPLYINNEYRDLDEGYIEIIPSNEERQLTGEIKIRNLPFLGDITEQDYLENSNIILFDDCLKTQEWAKNPSDSTLLLHSMESPVDIWRMNDYHFNQFLIANYENERDFDKIVNIKDIQKIHFTFTFCYSTRNKSYDDINLKVDIEFNDFGIVKRKMFREIDDGVGYEELEEQDCIIYLNNSFIQHYFNTRKITEVLVKEYLPGIEMIMDSNLYNQLKDKMIVSHKVERKE